MLVFRGVTGRRPASVKDSPALRAADILARMISEAHFRRIYTDSPAVYDELVTAEDRDDNLGRTLASIIPKHLATHVDIGAGTGRISRSLSRYARPHSTVAIDLAYPMLDQARAQSSRDLGGAWLPVVADAGALPVNDGAADLVTAGWVFGHVCEWSGQDWRDALARSLDEAARVCRGGGVIVVIDTLGTGTEAAVSPSPVLAGYHNTLNKSGFGRAIVRTDYDFASAADAERITGWFFGSPVATTITAGGRARVVEFTGIWWRAKSRGEVGRGE